MREGLQGAGRRGGHLLLKNGKEGFWCCWIRFCGGEQSALYDKGQGRMVKMSIVAGITVALHPSGKPGLDICSG